MAGTGFTLTSYPIIDDPYGDNVTQYSWMGWFYITTYGSVNQALFSRGLFATETSMTWLEVLPTGALRFDDSLPSGSPLDTAAGVVVRNQWNHIAAVRSTSNPTRSIYLNGEVVATQDDSESYGGSGNRQFCVGLNIRSATGASRRPLLYGTAFDCRPYNRTVPAEEIRHIYNMRGKDTPYDALLRWFIQDGPAGTSLTGLTVRDHTANGRHGVVQGAGMITAEDPFGSVRGNVGGI